METDLTSRVRGLLLRINSNEVIHAEHELSQVSQEEGFFASIFEVLCTDQEEWVRTTAASFLNAQFSKNLNEETSDYIVSLLLQILRDPRVKTLDKRIFEKSLIKHMDNSSTESRQNWLRLAREFLQSPLHFDTGLLIVACLAVAEGEPSPVPHMVEHIYEQVLTALPVAVENAVLLNEMLKTWVVVFDKVAGEEDRPTLTRMMSSHSLYRLLGALYCLESNPETLITTTAEFAELNFLKYEAAELHKRMLATELEEADEAFPLVLNFTQQFLPRMSRSLVVMVSQRPQIERLGCEDLLTSLLSIERHYLAVRAEEFRAEEVPAFQDLVLLPLLAVSDDEMHTFQENPSDFNTLTEDCCDTQTFGILKTQAAKLLERLGDKVPGSAEYSIRRAVDSLRRQLGYESGTGTGAPVLQVETSFLLLSIFSYQLPKYPVQLQQMQGMMRDEKLFGLPPLQLSRAFTFLAYNFKEVFREPAQGEGWLRLAISYRGHQTTSYCAFDFFSNIVEDYFSQELLDKFTDQVALGKLGLVWETVDTIVSNHFTSISTEGILTLIAKVFTRLHKERQLLKLREKIDFIDLVNCLRALMTVLRLAGEQARDSPATAPRRDRIVQAVWPVLDFLEESRALDVVDEMAKLATELVNALDSAVVELRPLLHSLSGLYRDSQFTEKPILKFLNQFLAKADFQRDVNEVVQTLVLLKDALLSFTQKVLEDGRLRPAPHSCIALCNVVLVLQNCVALFGTALVESGNADFFHQVSALCLRLLPRGAGEVEKTATGRLVQSRVFNLMFLCHMHLRVESIFELMALLQESKVYCGYDTKVLAQCVRKQVFKEEDLTGVVMLLSALARIAQLSTEKDAKIKQKRKSKDGKINASAKVHEDANRILKWIDSPFKNDLELPDLLRLMFAEMKANNQPMFLHVLQQLPHRDMAAYHALVDFDQLDKKQRVIRKVVGVKVGHSQILPLARDEERMDSDDDDPSSRKRVRVLTKREEKEQEKEQGKVKAKGQRRKQPKVE